jgi:hypothetical protein
LERETMEMLISLVMKSRECMVVTALSEKLMKQGKGYLVLSSLMYSSMLSQLDSPLASSYPALVSEMMSALTSMTKAALPTNMVQGRKVDSMEVWV